MVVSYVSQAVLNHSNLKGLSYKLLSYTLPLTSNAKRVRNFRSNFLAYWISLGLSGGCEHLVNLSPWKTNIVLFGQQNANKKSTTFFSPRKNFWTRQEELKQKEIQSHVTTTNKQEQ